MLLWVDTNIGLLFIISEGGEPGIQPVPCWYFKVNSNDWYFKVIDQT
jgi:hypothetical protein